MKRNILLLLAFVAFFVSCTSTDDPKMPEKPFNIVGTQWEADYRFSKEDPESALINVVLTFKTSTEVEFAHKVKEGEVDPKEYRDKYTLSYTYDSPVLKILSGDRKKWTIYNVDEKAGTMSTVRDEWVNEDQEGLIIGEDDIYKITLHLKK
ncbi:hypothetical protein [Phocaeicola sp.]|uniref:hypothetical protein n=1 Tax=Phocaeicola sp. TaxID=2773926 RepID=UPI003868813F